MRALEIKLIVCVAIARRDSAIELDDLTQLYDPDLSPAFILFHLRQPT